MPLPDRQQASVSPRNLMLIMVTTRKQKYTDTHSSSVISDISHFTSRYLQPSVDIPKASRVVPETGEGGSKNNSSTRLSVPDVSEHIFNIFS